MFGYFGRFADSTHLRSQAWVLCTALSLWLAGCDLMGQPSATNPTATLPVLSGTAVATRIGNSEPPSGSEASPTQAGVPEDSAVLTPEPTPTLLPESERHVIFDAVWGIIDDDYLYDDFHGVNWNQLRDQYEPKAIAASTAEQFYDTISEMVRKLNDKHSAYLSPWAAREEDDFINGHVNYVGIGIFSKTDENSLVVLFVFPNSPAEKAGLKRRDRITSADGHSVITVGTGESGIRGPALTTVRLTVQSPGQSPREVVVQRELVAGKLTASSHLLDADPTIGYLIVPSFFVGDMDKQVEAELTRLHQKALLHDQPLRGLVIDLRGNGGGWHRVLKAILAYLMSGDAGSLYTNNAYVQDILEQQDLSSLEITGGNLYDKFRSIPIIVLVDKNTASASEIMAAALQAKGRASVVGTRSMGNTETVFYYDLKDGSRLWVAEAAYLTPDGDSLEDKGVVPDAQVDIDWANYGEADDPQLLKAIELIHSADRR